LSLKAMVHAARAMYGRHPRTELEAAQELVQRVGAQGSRVWECRFAEAQIVSVLYWTWQRAQELYEQAIVLSHGEARYMSWYAAFLASQLRAEEAVAIMREAVSHFAHDVAVTRADMAFYQIVSGRLGEAEETLRSTLELFLNVHYIPYLHTAILREARGDFAGAAAAIQQVPMTPAEGTIIAGARYMFTGLAGDREDAERGYQSLQAQRQSDSEFIPASQVAMAALGTGNRDAAATWFEAAADERDPLLYLFGVLPFMRHLYSQPRFQSLMRETLKLGFGWQAQKKLA
jgi:Flp pilus assembly protein TadD